MGGRKVSDRTGAGGRRHTGGSTPSRTEKSNPSSGAHAELEGATAGGGPLAVASRLPQVNLRMIDDEKLTAAADAVAAEYAPPPAAALDPLAAAPPDPNAPPVVSTEDAEKGYRLLGLAVVGQSCLLLVPAWHVTTEEQTTVSDAIVQALMLWFPDGLIPAKYLALLVLASAVGTIALSRIDPATGELPPRHAPPKKPTVPPAPAAAGAGVDPRTQIQPTH